MKWKTPALAGVFYVLLPVTTALPMNGGRSFE
jgi:hypothetical protein